MAARKHKTVLIRTSTGRKLLSSMTEASRQLGRSSGGIAAHASGKGHEWDSDSARKAALKRWRRHPDTGRGYRRGQRFVRKAPVKRAPLRELYSTKSVKGIRYHPDTQTWSLTDAHGFRPISERTALRRLGHIDRANDSVVPETIEKIVTRRRTNG